MNGGNAQETRDSRRHLRHLGVVPPVVKPFSRPQERPVPHIREVPKPQDRPVRSGDPEGRERFHAERRESRAKARKAQQTGIYRRRRVGAMGLLVIGILALVVAVLIPSIAYSGEDYPAPIDPKGAGPDTSLATAGKLDISTPVRPSDLTGLGYHPEGEGLVQLEPKGKNLSSNPLLALLAGDKTPEELRYYVMDNAGRDGDGTGALDVGARSGTNVYAPVDGMITSIKPDPSIQNANVVEIQPTADPDARVSISLVQNREGDVGVKSPVDAGETKLGTVADSAKFLDPQLSGYTGEAGNHVTVTVADLG